MGIELIGFIAVVLLAYLIPGPDFLLVSRYAVKHRRLGLAAALGAQSGLCIHMLTAALGLSAIAARSAELFMLIRWAGAAYLIWMGLAVLYSSRSQHRQTCKKTLMPLAVAVLLPMAFCAICSTLRRSSFSSVSYPSSSIPRLVPLGKF